MHESETLKYALILFLPILIYSACNKKDTEASLPAATHTGANTLGCLIDGKVFVVIGKYSTSSSSGVFFIPFSNSAWVADGSTGSQHISLSFDYNQDPHIPGVFEMANNYPAGAKFINPTDGSAVTGGNEFKTDSVHNGSITLTHYDGKITAGTFSFDCANDAGQVVHITEGRFDITL